MVDAPEELIACYACERCSHRSAGYSPLCRRCGHGTLKRVEATPGGTVLDFVPVRYPPDNLRSLGAYVSVLVRLDDGCELFGIVRGDPGPVAIGRRVVAVAGGDRGGGEGPFFETR